MGWEGEKLLGKALASLASSKGTSAKRIHYVTQVALDYAKVGHLHCIHLTQDVINCVFLLGI